MSHGSTKDKSMSTSVAIQVGTAEWRDSIAKRIHSRTWGRIDRLQVESTANRIVIHGAAQSYYDKQLAIQAVLDLLGGATEMEFSLDIWVYDNRQQHAITSHQEL
jgi:hypothetical protein